MSLPDGSRLEVDLAAEAKSLELWVGGPDPSTAIYSLQGFVREVYSRWTREGRLA